MSMFEYKCPNNHITTERRLYKDRDRPIVCECGAIANVIFSVANWSFGWKLSDESLMDGERRGADEYVRNI